MAIGDELSSLDFANIIGGPMNAVVQAQAKAAMTTVDFIKDVGFDSEGKVINVTFSYERQRTDGSTGTFSLSVPFLTMVVVPNLIVDCLEIKFNAKINSVQETKVSDQLKIGVDVSAKVGWGWGSASLKVSVSKQKQTDTTNRTEREYSLSVYVKSRQAELPAGQDRLFDILEQAISEEDTNPPANP